MKNSLTRCHRHCPASPCSTLVIGGHSCMTPCITDIFIDHAAAVSDCRNLLCKRRVVIVPFKYYINHTGHMARCEQDTHRHLPLLWQKEICMQHCFVKLPQPTSILWRHIARHIRHPSAMNIIGECSKRRIFEQKIAVA